MTISVVLLAGGIGTRMGSEIPKQFLPLENQPIALYSLEIFVNHPEVNEIVVVCEAKYRTFFENYKVHFAEPGERRQDSLYNGLKKCSPSASYICVHDAARPFINKDMVTRLFQEGKRVGAATVGMPLKSTVKETSSAGLVQKTLEREKIVEIQTPQFIKKNVLEEGFKKAIEQKITVTDDVSLAELVGHPVQIVAGSYQNLKITTPEDLIFAKCISTKS